MLSIFRFEWRVRIEPPLELSPKMGPEDEFIDIYEENLTTGFMTWSQRFSNIMKLSRSALLI
jgi:hypothetical protein